MALAGALLLAMSNVLCENIVKSNRDAYHYLGFLGLFGSLTAYIEATLIFKEQD
jgi:hypothetical protein